MRRYLYTSVAGLALVGSLAACTGSPGKPPAAAKPSATTKSTVPPSPSSGLSSSNATPPAISEPVAPPKGGGGGGGTAPAAGRKPDRCHTANLRGEFHRFSWPGQAGAESEGDLGLTNTGRQPCVIYGYAGIQLIAGTGKPLPTKVVRATPPGPTSITLAPGKTAWALVASRFTPNADEENSDPLCGGPVNRIKVIPPDETAQLTVDGEVGHVCQHGELYVTPFQAARPSTQPPPVPGR